MISCSEDNRSSPSTHTRVYDRHVNGSRREEGIGFMDEIGRLEDVSRGDVMA
jgi:hypothetical protein